MAGLGRTFRTGLGLGFGPSPVDAYGACSLTGARGPGELASVRPAFGYGELKKRGPVTSGRWRCVIRSDSTGFIAPEEVGDNTNLLLTIGRE